MKLKLILLILGILLFVSCSKQEPVKNNEDSEAITDITEAPESVEKVDPPVIIEPEVTETEVLPEISFTTGLPCTLEAKMVRPIAVMYNNLKLSYPQNEISKADIIYECDAEGGITRLMAIFSDWKDLQNIGSLRSARDYFVSLSQSHGAIYVHAGGSPTAYERLIYGDVDHVDGVNMNYLPKNTFYRDSYRIRNNGYEHSMMTDGEKLSTAIKGLKYTTEYPDGFVTPYSFNAEAVTPDGQTADVITLSHSSYSTVEFNYDSKSDLYYKSSYGAPHIDGANGEQLSFSNVLVLFVKEKIVDEEGRLDIDLTSGGDGYYISQGKYIKIKWSRKNNDAPFVFESDGALLSLNPGKTHITLFNGAHKENIVIK